MSEKKKGTYMRLSPRTLKIVRVYAGLLQAELGRPVSDEMALESIFNEHRPDVVEKADAIPDGDESVARKPGRRTKTGQ